MKKVNCTLTVPSGRIEWPCYESGVPGLVVHRGIDFTGSDPGTQSYIAKPSEWSVSHELSGQRIMAARFRSRRAAVQFAEASADLADWTQSAEQLVMVPDLYNKLRSIKIRFFGQII